MTAIRLLSEGLINRIAAGEVVERPASVLKELIENSLDAGADRIEIDVQGGGRRLVMVTDNGRGMGPDDLLLAVERHATSKLTEETDLLQIETLGFRGEALPSIGAVSRLTITSAPDQDGRGRRIFLTGGRLIKVEDAARDQGTSVEARDLFFNVPARRKFLKSVQTEGAHLLETAQRYALARSGVRLVYRNNGQEVLATSPREDDRARVARVLGRDTARGMFPFQGQVEGVFLSGFLGRPELDRSRFSGLYLFVNGRPVTDRLLARAVMDAYRGRITSGRYPVAVIFVTVDPQMVDVNVHPAKAEVRFRQPGQVFNAAADVMARALNKVQEPFKPRPMYTPSPSPAPASLGEAVVWEAKPDQGLDQPAFIPSSALEIPQPRPDMTPGQNSLRPIGQLFRSYILAQGQEGLFIIDQHAAHERVLFERLKSQLTAGPLASQGMLLPQTLELTPTQAAGLEQLAPDLVRFGFDLEPFGGQTFVLRAVPLVLAGKEASRILTGILEGMEAHRPEAGLDNFEEKTLQSLACHAAVKAGDEMSLPEMDRLLTDLDQTLVPTHCPHGRPLIFHLDRREIEKRFKRS